MKATPALARVLLQLTDTGSIAASKVTATVSDLLAGLFDAGVLAEGRRGAGRQIVVADAEALAAVVERWFPGGLTAVLETPASRAQAVAVRRDAKSAPRADTEPVLVRGFGDAVLHRGDETLKVGHWTSVAGYAAVEIGGAEEWGCNGTVVVVENLEPFRQVERVVPEVDLAVYAAGRLSARGLDWLAKLRSHGCRLIHWGDYDPVGMDEFLRLHDACCGGVELVVVGDLEEQFRRFGKRELVAGSEGLLRRLRGCGHEAVTEVVGLMDRFGCGVEQEAGLGEVHSDPQVDGD